MEKLEKWNKIKAGKPAFFLCKNHAKNLLARIMPTLGRPGAAGFC
jgi:hypothetical protein